MVLPESETPPVPYEPFSYRRCPRVLTGRSDSGFVKHEPSFKEQTVNRQRILISLSVVAVALAAATAARARAVPAPATGAGTAGFSLNLPAGPSISNTLDGSDQTASYSPVLGVVD